MSFSVDVYKGTTKLGSGTATGGSTSITSFTVVTGRVVTSGRNVQVTATTGNNVGASINTRVITDGGTSLTLKDALPFT